ncbi:MAG TPA: hypothetical protein VGM27_24505 [Acidobacteriaceae bacterium]
MVILVPWDPVALVLGLLSASILSAISDRRLCAAEKIPSLSAQGNGSPQPRIMPNDIPQAQSPIARRSESIVQAIGGTVSTNTTD